jgi:hypothetical protein
MIKDTYARIYANSGISLAKITFLTRILIPMNSCLFAIRIRYYVLKFKIFLQMELNFVKKWVLKYIKIIFKIYYHLKITQIKILIFKIKNVSMVYQDKLNCMVKYKKNKIYPFNLNKKINSYRKKTISHNNIINLYKN